MEEIGHKVGGDDVVEWGEDMVWEECSIEYLRDRCRCMMSGGI